MAGVGKNLEITNVESGHPGSGEIIIRNHAVALQPLDAKILIAGYGPASKLLFPSVLGTSGAGVIEELGAGVLGFTVGDRVVFDTKAYVDTNDNVRTGSWQQSVACDATTVAKVYSRSPRRTNGRTLTITRLETSHSSKRYS